MKLPLRSVLRVAPTTTLALAALALGASAQQQVRFSIDWQSISVGAPDSTFGFPITEGDVLAPTPPAPGFGPLPLPGIAFTAGGLPAPGLGLGGHAGCAGHPGGTPCIVEVDALSYGNDFAPFPGAVLLNAVRFSTDEYAVGFPGASFPPTIWTEGPAGDLAADVLVDTGIGVMPTPPFAAVVPGSVAFLDGDGMVSTSTFLYPGVGLVEPRPPVPVLPKPGDNLDALEIGPPSPTGAPPFGFFFSLDAPWPDPLTGFPNTSSAIAHGFSSADVVHTPVPGGAPILYAPAPALGLDFLGGPNSDDLDALALTENGIPGYQPSQSPFDWVNGQTDMLLFSVRRGSALIGAPDSIFGLPIEPGDILTTPLPTALGGMSPFPGIFIAAENLGLATMRTTGVPFGDDLDALDVELKPLFDCNGNGIEDAIDIAVASSADANGNGIPDECEGGITYACFCAPALAPCGNADSGAGCANSTGVGALLTGSGSTSVSADDLVLTTTQAPIFQNGVLFMGNTLGAPVPFRDGLRCVGGLTTRWPLNNSGPTGTFTYGPGMSAWSIANMAPPFHLLSGATWNFQMWYRDPTGPCALGSNLSNSASVTFVP